MNRWAGRTAIVTGASSGIGAAIAKLLTQHGLNVVGVARREDRVQELAEELKKEGTKGKLHTIKGDVSKEEDIKNVVKWTRENLGGADVLVNNAGVAPTAVLHRFRTENIRKIYETNVIGLAVFTREVVQDMRARGVDDGHVIHINSISGHSIIQMRGIYPYSGSKHAVTVLTEGLRRELVELKSKIRVTSISPGLVRTGIMVATGAPPDVAEQMYNSVPCLEAKDVADALIYALSTPPHVQVHEIIIHPTGEDLNSSL
ncbi:farnesol dehydrogenase-like [Neocloeon triangulifer]|uniref:farnesol dehydrogenase-like n=1 Tax=Neocloeon triangulifer TaxID=2078957 RepID=UPI00286EBF5D|nr:farnesol dehydrogenase-like [Neocloeon triangulifer]